MFVLCFIHIAKKSIIGIVSHVEKRIRNEIFNYTIGFIVWM